MVAIIIFLLILCICLVGLLFDLRSQIVYKEGDTVTGYKLVTLIKHHKILEIIKNLSKNTIDWRFVSCAKKFVDTNFIFNKENTDKLLSEGLSILDILNLNLHKNNLIKFSEISSSFALIVLKQTNDKKICEAIKEMYKYDTEINKYTALLKIYKLK